MTIFQTPAQRGTTQPIAPALIHLVLSEAFQKLTVRGEWQASIRRAQLMIDAAEMFQIPAQREGTNTQHNTYRIRSPRTGNVYITTAHSCTCQRGLVGTGGPCWHRAAARAADIALDYRQCRYCRSHMIARGLYYRCTNLGCQHEHEVAVADTLPYWRPA
jgi:hypothetical protein